jgi:hypothetical protein
MIGYWSRGFNTERTESTEKEIKFLRALCVSVGSVIILFVHRAAGAVVGPGCKTHVQWSSTAFPFAVPVASI